MAVCTEVVHFNRTIVFVKLYKRVNFCVELLLEGYCCVLMSNPVSQLSQYRMCVVNTNVPGMLLHTAVTCANVRDSSNAYFRSSSQHLK